MYLGAHVLRACCLRSVPFPWVLGPRVEAVSKCCLHMLLKRGSESSSCISHLHDHHWKATGCASGMEDQAASWALLVPGMRLPTSFHLEGRRWGNMRGICCRSKLKMLNVVPPQIPNLYSHLDLSPLFLLSSWACYSWEQGPVIRKAGH